MTPSRLRRVGVVTLLASAVVLASAAPASAAGLCVRLSTIPVHPAAGQPIQIDLRTLRPASGSNDEYRLEPHPVPSTFPFHVTAESGDQLVLIHVQRTGDPNLWTGQFVLGQGGLWRLVVENLERTRAPLDPRCYSQLPFVVAAPGGRPEQHTLRPSGLGLTLFLAVGVLALLVGTTLFVVIRSRVPPPNP